MVKESSAKMSRLPGPNIFSSPSPGYKAMARSDSGRLQREEQVQEIIELKKALAKTRQDLQKTRSRRGSQDNRSSSDEETGVGYKREEMFGSMSGSMSAVSNKPCLNRELLAKLRSMTETIKMLSTENVALREENDQLMSVRDDGMTAKVDDTEDVVKLRSMIQSYEKQVNDLSGKVKTLEQTVELKEKQPAASVPQQEKDKYKSLARRLKEERNQYRDLVEEKKQEQGELKVEIEKMTEIIGDLRDNCGKLQEELLQVRNDSPRRVREKAIQTTGPVRRSSLSEASPRARITPKRTRSTITPPSSSSGSSSPRQSQISRSIELSKPKIRNTAATSLPSSPAKGARIVKPVQRSPSNSSIPPKNLASPKPSPARVSPGKISRIPTPSKSKIPVKPQPRASIPDYDDSDEILYINEESLTGSDDNMDVVTEMPRKMTEKMDVEPTPTLPSAENIQPVFPPPLIAEETANSEPEFPAPPRPEDLEALSLEAEMTAVPPPPPPIEEEPPITTPRTLRRADSMRQRMAAKRIQRTWKHFYQELEEKKTDGEGEGTAETRDVRAESLPGVQAAILSHGARVASLAAARARGGIYTARPWQGRESDETESENEDIIESLQGIIRSQSFRLKNLRGEDAVFQPGKVSSIRQKFVRKSPDGASDDSMADTDTIA